MNLRHLSERRPLFFSLAAIVLASVFTEIPLQKLFLPLVGEAYADYVPGMLEQYLATVGVVVLAGLVGLSASELGFRRTRPGKALVLGWPLLAFTLINIPTVSLTGPKAIALVSPLALVLFLLYLSTGFIEESLFRGLVSGLLRRRWARDRQGLYRAVLVSSLLFGLTHIANLFQHRYTPLASLTQIAFGFFFGVLFESLALRTKSLWPGIALHAILDFVANLDRLEPGALPRSQGLVTKTPLEALVSVGITLPLLFLGLYFLRKVEAGKGESPACADLG